MTEKVKLAVFDQDLIVRKSGKFPLSSCGSKIKVVSGGEAHFMPQISNTTYLDFPRRSLWPPFRKYLERIYFVRNTAKKCVDFQTQEVPMPDPQQVMDAAGAKIASQWGKDSSETPIISWAIIALLIMIVAKLFGVIQ